MKAPGLFHTIGGTATCQRLSKAFYARVDHDPTLRPFFPGKSLHCAIEEFAAFLVQFLGGPAEDSEWRRYLSLRESHKRFAIEGRHRDAWLRLMDLALDDVGIEEPARGELWSLFEQASAHVIEVPAQAAPMNEEMAQRWERQQRLEEAVAAVRAGDRNRAIELVAQCDPAVLPGLLALMIESGDPALLSYAHERLTKAQRYNGRTLLHVAVMADRLRTVELLLRLGADPNAFDGGKHTPLYYAKSGPVVHALVRAGAEVDARDGVMRTTALHMAARFGSVEVAKALLECGADIDARDRREETPLQRAINCKKAAVAELLRNYRTR
jgi:hemoglobin